MDKCEICCENSLELGKLQKLYQKGYENLVEKCRYLEDSSLIERLEIKWSGKIPIGVHKNCRTTYLKKVPDSFEIQNDGGTRQKRQSVAENHTTCHSGKIYHINH